MKIMIVDDRTDKNLTRMLAAALDDGGALIPILTRITGAVEGVAEAEKGWAWNVQIIEAGDDLQKRFSYPLDVIHAAAPLYEGAPVFMHSASQHLDPKQRQIFGPSLKDKVGWLSNVGPNSTGLKGVWNIYKSEPELRLKVMDSFEREKNSIGLSHDVNGITAARKDGVHVAKKIVKVNSVDVVYDPIGGGKLIDMAAAGQAGQKEENMKWLQLMLAALKGMRPKLAGQIDGLLAKGDAVTEVEVQQLLAAAVEKPEDVAAMIAQFTAAMKPAAGGDTDEAKKLLAAAEAKFAETTKLLACYSKLGTMLAAEAKLPDYAKMRVKAQFDGRVFEDAQLTAAITAEKKYLDKMQADMGFIDLPGGDRQMLVMGSGERMQAALDKMMGVKVAKELENEVPFEGLRAAYVRMTGDTMVRGVLDPGQMRKLQAAGFDSSTFSYAFGNTLYRLLAKDYAESPDFGLSLLISNERNAKDFRTMEAIKIGYFGDLPTVANVKQDGWPDLGVLSDEEVSYALGQQGGIVTVDRVMIINNDLGVVQKIMTRIPRAARITRARKAWNILINNAVYTGDGKALFHTDHGNLGTTAYSLAELLVIRTAMRKQTEPDSGNRIFLTNKSETVVIPTDLWGTANGINKQPPTLAVPNQMFEYFGAASERIFENNLMTDVTDYFVLGNPKEVDILEIAYLNGVKEPEMFVANNPAAGQMFYNDQIQYKIRQEDAVTALDYRGVYKEVVAG